MYNNFESSGGGYPAQFLRTTQNTTIHGELGQTIADSDIQWDVAENVGRAVSYEANKYLPTNGVEQDALADGAANAPTNLVAIIQDPTFFYIAIGCFIIFTISMLKKDGWQEKGRQIAHRIFQSETGSTFTWYVLGLSR